jgi:asparagine synthase (glutamine-hydrolysing)
LDEKFLLKRAVRDLLPATVTNRVKQPYRAPDAQSFLEQHAPDYVRELLSPERIAIQLHVRRQYTSMIQ